jgi:hypothetical protein
MRFLISVALFLGSAASYAQDPRLSPNAPEDKPVPVQAEGLSKFEAAIAPYVAQAKSTYPLAKSKFLAGLPEGQSFFVTTQLRRNGFVEQVFVAVRSIDGDMISGRIWSDVQLVPGFKHGDAYRLPEAEIIDWLITYPDGSEEGNVVGKFLDTYSGA